MLKYKKWEEKASSQGTKPEQRRQLIQSHVQSIADSPACPEHQYPSSPAHPARLGRPSTPQGLKLPVLALASARKPTPPWRGVCLHQVSQSRRGSRCQSLCPVGATGQRLPPPAPEPRRQKDGASRVPGMAVVRDGVFPRQREPTSNESLAGCILSAPSKDSAPCHPGEGPPAPASQGCIHNQSTCGVTELMRPAAPHTPLGSRTPLGWS